MNIEDWHKELKGRAKRRGLGWLIVDDPECYRDGFSDGNTPTEELDEQVSATQS